MSGKSYLIFYPSVELGGAEILFARLADQLASRGNSVTVLDSENKIIIDNLTVEGVGALVANSEPLKFTSCDYIIAFASNILDVTKYIDCESSGKVLWWSVHPFNSIYLPPIFGSKLASFGVEWLRFVNGFLFSSEDAIRKSTIQALSKANAFVCMDGENSNTINSYYQTCTDFKYIPVPVNLAECRESRDIKSGDAISFFWYGRLCDFKVHGLVYLIEKISELNDLKHSVRLTVIGDGPYREFVENEAEKLGVEVLFVGVLPNSESVSLLKNQADVVFAMGTSALESGALGIPTILMGASFSKINFNYKFEWLYNTSCFTLGVFLRNKNLSVGLSIIELLGEIRKNSGDHAFRCHQYVKTNHDMNHVVELVEKNAALSAMDYKSFSQLIKYKRPIVNRIAVWVRQCFAFSARDR
jgi:glycosyltransferase involved in cell wall biosynthesis